MKFGALLFIVLVKTDLVINFQLLGGIWILQTLPTVFLGLYTRWFNRWALIVGWAAAMIFGTVTFILAGNKSTAAFLDIPMYIAISSLLINLALSIVLTPLCEAIGLKRGVDHTQPADYNEEEAPVEPVETGQAALS